jgi:hypothetical protein
MFANPQIAYQVVEQEIVDLMHDELNYDVVYARSNSSLNKPAHFIAISEKDYEIVLVIRGTKSTEDILTDLVSSSEFLFPGDELRKYTGHRGMVVAAHYLHSTTAPLLRALMTHQNGYKLSIIGHSLGAGTASLLACLMVCSCFPITLECP